MTTQRIFFLFFLMLCVSFAAGNASARNLKKPVRPAVEVNLDVLDSMGERDPDTYSRIAPSSGTQGADMYEPHEIEPVTPEFIAIPVSQPEFAPEEDAYEPVFEPEKPRRLPPTKIIDPADVSIRQSRAEIPPVPRVKTSNKPPISTDITEEELVQPTAQDILNSLEGLQ